MYRFINKKTDRKKFQKNFKSMKDYLVEYELSSGVNYRIYHSETKEFKVSRDVIFDEGEFFNARYVSRYSDEILPFVEDDTDQKTEHESEKEQNENVAPIVYDQVVVESPPSSYSF